MTPPLTPSQDLLLQAALRSGAPALAAWRTWLALNDLEHTHLDPDSNALLPLIYTSLSGGEAAEVPHLGRLRGVYRRTWVANEMCFRAVGAGLARLAEADIPTLLPDGAGLALRFYEQHAQRPVGGQTVWVRAEQAQAAVRCLAGAGWRPVTRLPARLTALRNRLRGAWLLRDGAGHVLIVLARKWSAGEQALWAAAAPLSVGGTAILALAPADQLVYVGAPAPGPRLRALADAEMIRRALGAGALVGHGQETGPSWQL